MFKSTVQDVRSSSYWMSICMVMCVRTWRMWKEAHQDCNTFSASSAEHATVCTGAVSLTSHVPSHTAAIIWNKNLCIMTVTFAVKKSYSWFVYNSEIDQTLSSLETLAKVFDHPTGHLNFSTMQVQPPYMSFLHTYIHWYNQSVIFFFSTF